jgi:hypothetical protein
MSSRQRGKHRSRHHAHAVKPASLPKDWKLPPLPKEEAPAESAKATSDAK